MAQQAAARATNKARWCPPPTSHPRASTRQLRSPSESLRPLRFYDGLRKEDEGENHGERSLQTQQERSRESTHPIEAEEHENGAGDSSESNDD